MSELTTKLKLEEIIFCPLYFFNVSQLCFIHSLLDNDGYLPKDFEKRVLTKTDKIRVDLIYDVVVRKYKEQVK